MADPRVGYPSTSVQIQNRTYFDLSILVGADYWTVTPSQSATIPLPGDGAPITVTALNNTAATHSGPIVAIWNLDHQSVPQPDGPLTGPTGG